MRCTGLDYIALSGQGEGISKKGGARHAVPLRKHHGQLPLPALDRRPQLFQSLAVTLQIWMNDFLIKLHGAAHVLLRLAEVTLLLVDHYASLCPGNTS